MSARRKALTWVAIDVMLDDLINVECDISFYAVHGCFFTIIISIICVTSVVQKLMYRRGGGTYCLVT